MQNSPYRGFSQFHHQIRVNFLSYVVFLEILSRKFGSEKIKRPQGIDFKLKSMRNNCANLNVT